MSQTTNRTLPILATIAAVVLLGVAMSGVMGADDEEDAAGAIEVLGVVETPSEGEATSGPSSTPTPESAAEPTPEATPGSEPGSDAEPTPSPQPTPDPTATPETPLLAAEMSISAVPVPPEGGRLVMTVTVTNTGRLPFTISADDFTIDGGATLVSANFTTANIGPGGGRVGALIYSVPANAGSQTLSLEISGIDPITVSI